MRLIKSCEEGLVFHVSPREKELLFMLLKLYPRIPAGHHKLSKTAPLNAADQALLEEALQEQRAENQQRVRRLLAEPARWAQTDTGWRMTLAEAELEWLLQVLNDIRVGSWVRLGAPEQLPEKLTEATAPHFWAMEVSGGFQMALLAALDERP